MLLTVLSLYESRLRLHKNVVQLNQEQPTRSHTRVGADGLAKTVITRPKALCDGAKTTGVLLIQRAREQAIRMLANPLHRDQFTSSDGEKLPDVPPIEVNGKELSEKRGLTDRALRNHLVQLKQVGIIVKRKFRGTRASFHVWMNPELVWGLPQKPSETAKESAHNRAISIANGMKVPDTEVLETLLETPEIEITDGDKLITKSTVKLDTGNPLLESEARNGRSCRRKKNGAGSAVRPSKSEPIEEVVQDKVLLKKMELVVEFWEHAKALLYPGQKWTIEQERMAKNAIWTGVFNNFYNPAKIDWYSNQLAFLHRLYMVRKHLQSHPEGYIPLPYGQYKPGAGYFDAANKNGFVGTAAWLKKENKRKQSLIVDRALRIAISEVDQHKLLTRTPDIKLKTHERVRSFSLLQLIKYHEGVLKRLGSAKALDHLYKKVAKPSKSTFKFNSTR